MQSASGKIGGTRPCANSHVVVVRLPEAGYGSLECAKLARARRLLLSLANQPGPRYLIVDLCGVHYLGAGFVGIVVSAWDELRKHDRRLLVCGLNPNCATLFHNLYLDRLFAIHPTLQIALEEIGAARRSKDGEGGTTPQVRVRASDVDWDPELLRLEYLGDNDEPIRCVIVQRRR